MNLSLCSAWGLRKERAWRLQAVRERAWRLHAVRERAWRLPALRERAWRLPAVRQGILIVSSFLLEQVRKVNKQGCPMGWRKLIPPLSLLLLSYSTDRPQASTTQELCVPFCSPSLSPAVCAGDHPAHCGPAIWLMSVVQRDAAVIRNPTSAAKDARC